MAVTDDAVPDGAAAWLSLLDSDEDTPTRPRRRTLLAGDALRMCNNNAGDEEDDDLSAGQRALEAALADMPRLELDDVGVCVDACSLQLLATNTTDGPGRGRSDTLPTTLWLTQDDGRPVRDALTVLRDCRVTNNSWTHIVLHPVSLRACVHAVEDVRDLYMADLSSLVVMERVLSGATRLSVDRACLLFPTKKAGLIPR